MKSYGSDGEPATVFPFLPSDARSILLRLIASCLVALLATFVVFETATSAAVPKPWQWTTAQASAAIMRQAEDFYVETTDAGYRFPRDLTSTKCRGVGKAVGRRFVAFTCVAVYQRGVADPLGSIRVLAKTRRSGGLCWAVTPAAIPSGCLARGARTLGSLNEVARVVYKQLGAPAQSLTITPHGAGFYSWTWRSGDVTHHGIVVFAPRPLVTVLD